VSIVKSSDNPLRKHAYHAGYLAQRPPLEKKPAIKLCATVSLEKKEIKKTATSIRHAINKVITRAMDDKSLWLKE
jgi:hypothetical protein